MTDNRCADYKWKTGGKREAGNKGYGGHLVIRM